MQQQQLEIWQAWAGGEITDDQAQAAAEAVDSKKQLRRGRVPARPPDASAGFSESRRGNRDKVFGEGRCVPLDRNAKARVMALARFNESALPRPQFQRCAGEQSRCDRQRFEEANNVFCARKPLQ